tara:strand:- start:518 stop:919 length:402 start_codon:yes stop_codon:yes gene_type:complete
MAHFAELDSNNKVLRIVVGCDTDVTENGGAQSEQAATHFETVVPLSLNGVKWVETSYDGSFRRQYASIDGYYDSDQDVFIDQKPYPSWTLNSNKIWEAPVPRPAEHSSLSTWDEDNQTWVDYTPSPEEPEEDA